MTTLLMTGTIDAGYFGNVSTKVTDTEERKQQYYQTIEKYIRETKFDNIVFAENSHYPFDAERFVNLASDYQKRFEYVEVDTNIEKTQLKGKSYGEACLIAQAVQNSEIFKEGIQVFYKVTGRVFVRNINQLINEKMENLFITHNIYNSCLTVFFKMRVDTFKKCLLDAENSCNEFDGKNFIEAVYYKKLVGENIKCFKRYPDLSGIIGGSGQRYDRNKRNLFLKNILIKLGYYSYGKGNIRSWKKIEKMEIIVSQLLKN